MQDYKIQYYEQEVFWNKDYLQFPSEKQRIEEVIRAVPSTVRNILDVGCGNGTFINFLFNTFSDKFERIVGLDSSKEALKYVMAEKYHGMITSLPFQNNSFDLVTSLEVLEHLPLHDFKNGLLELQRVSKQYILITVPNNEELEQSLIKCPKCYCHFNPCFHMRNFSKTTLQQLFSMFTPVTIKEIGPPIKYGFCYRNLRAIYLFWKRKSIPTTAICPQCGYQRLEETQILREKKEGGCFRPNISSVFKTLANIALPMKKKQQWLLALYQKRLV